MTYTKAEKCYIALSLLPDISDKRKLAMVFEAGDEERCLDKLNNHSELEQFLTSLDAQGVTAVTIKSTLYPYNLKNLDNPPLVLYCRGNVELMSKRCVSIVGTRDCTRYGTDVAYRFGKGLAEHGVVVVSGLADGIDTAAHKGAVSAKNDDGILSIAVLGNGVNYYYPQSNASLQKDLAQNGLIISEYIPSTPSDRFHFPHRNRIIAALCSAVIVVEADNRSGALITKDYALDLGVDVFAVPGPITSYASNGTNKIIKTAAVAMITDIADVLDTFGVTVRGEEENSVTQISFEAQSVLDVLGRDEVHFDEIVEKTKYAPKTVASLLTNMEIDGLILKLSGNYYTSKVMKKRK